LHCNRVFKRAVQICKLTRYEWRFRIKVNVFSHVKNKGFIRNDLEVVLSVKVDFGSKKLRIKMFSKINNVKARAGKKGL